MKYKTIKNFLLNYNESSWSRLIPSLLEIAILNLHISFKTYFFSEKDLENIITDLKSNFKKKLRNNEITNNRNLDEIILEKSNKEYEDRNKRRKNINREINEDEDEDELYGRDDIKKKKNNKSNYAISYDKNLRPEIIEKKEIKNKKGGKIIKRMTEEEYNAQYDSQGEEREREIKKKKNKKKKRSRSKNYKKEKEQIPDQDNDQDVQEFNNFNNNAYQQ